MSASCCPAPSPDHVLVAAGAPFARSRWLTALEIGEVLLHGCEVELQPVFGSRSPHTKHLLMFHVPVEPLVALQVGSRQMPCLKTKMKLKTVPRIP